MLLSGGTYVSGYILAYQLNLSKILHKQQINDGYSLTEQTLRRLHLHMVHTHSLKIACSNVFMSLDPTLLQGEMVW